jgi:hypothetical protein
VGCSASSLQETASTMTSSSTMTSTADFRSRILHS